MGSEWEMFFISFSLGSEKQGSFEEGGEVKSVARKE